VTAGSQRGNNTVDETLLETPATPVVITPRGGHAGGRHRVAAPSSAMRGRATVLAVAASAAVSAASAGSALDTHETHPTETRDLTLLANGDPAPTTSSPAAPAPSSPATATPSQPEPVVVENAGAATEDVAATMLYAGTEINTQ